jgi:KDO2-lipid IV(A) lauroyltransferase
MVEHYLGLRGIGVTVITGQISNRFLDRELKGLRSQNGMRVLPKVGALREIRSRLRQGEVIGLLADQNSPKRERFFDFFGVPASTYTEYARVLARAGCPTLFVACIRDGFQLRYKLIVRDLSAGLPDLQGLPRAQRASLRADELVRRYLKASEDLAREEPEQYWWGHRRWKSRPTGAPWLYHDLGKPLGRELLESKALFQ